MGNMFCNAKISACTMYNSEGSASSADKQSKDFIKGFTTSLEINPSEFIPKAWFEAKGYDIQMDGFHYTTISSVQVYQTY